MNYTTSKENVITSRMKQTSHQYSIIIKTLQINLKFKSSE
jgi:hypothetical protein